jgi:hypothetical protein
MFARSPETQLMPGLSEKLHMLTGRLFNRQCHFPNNRYQFETFEKCFPLKAGFKFKEGDNFNWRNTLSILRLKI